MAKHPKIRHRVGFALCYRCPLLQGRVSAMVYTDFRDWLSDLISKFDYNDFASLTTGKVSSGLELLADVVQGIGDADLPKTVSLPGVVRLDEAGFDRTTVPRRYDRVTVERRMKSVTRPWMLKLEPTLPQLQGKRLILKPEDIGQEACAMCIIERLNAFWRCYNIRVCGHYVYAKTYRMFLVSPQVSFVEVVEGTITLDKLKRQFKKQGHPVEDRVARLLGNDEGSLNLLAATTAGFLACSYLLGIRDGHGDNLLLNAGELFRIDFGFLFGDRPWIDSDSVWLPKAVLYALGEERLEEVFRQVKRAVNAVLRQGEEATCALLEVDVFEVAFGMQAERYVKGLSLKEFEEKLQSICHPFLLGKGLKSFTHQLGYGNQKGHNNLSAEKEGNMLSPAALAFLASPGGFDFVRQLARLHKFLQRRHVMMEDLLTEISSWTKISSCRSWLRKDRLDRALSLNAGLRSGQEATCDLLMLAELELQAESYVKGLSLQEFFDKFICQRLCGRLLMGALEILASRCDDASQGRLVDFANLLIESCMS